MLDEISQIAIFTFGILSIILIARKNKYGLVFGLLSEPFWFITTYINKQWGVFLVAIIYTLSYIYGIYNWFKKK